MSFSPEAKSALRSTTVWGAIIGAASGVVQIVTHHAVPADVQNQVVGVIIQGVDFVSSAGVLWGAAQAVYGRVVATQKIG